MTSPGSEGAANPESSVIFVEIMRLMETHAPKTGSSAATTGLCAFFNKDLTNGGHLRTKTSIKTSRDRGKFPGIA
jgi:hypothetical protein